MHTNVRLSIVAITSAVLAGVGCGAANTSGNTLLECRALTAAAAQRPPQWTGTMFTIVMENHRRDQIIGNADAPFINGLARQGAEAAGYHDAYVHPSEPNYIWMVAGENFGILNDADPNPANNITSQSHLADQIERAGLTWKAYQESMGEPCGLTSHGKYAVKHNPFAYFTDINGWDGTAFHPSARCTDHIVDYAQLDTDLASGQVPDYAFITPNMVNDMHDGSIATGDAWLAAEVPEDPRLGSLQERRRAVPAVGRRQQRWRRSAVHRRLTQRPAGNGVARRTTTRARSSRRCRRCSAWRPSPARGRRTA